MADTRTHTRIALEGVTHDPAPHTRSARVQHDPLALDISNLSVPLRLQLAVIARSSASAEEALPLAIAAIVGDQPAKLDALVAAFSNHPRLANQWQRAYQTLLRTTE